ncbi:MAG: glutamine synthetase family protein [Geminicoccales bacterium]
MRWLEDSPAIDHVTAAAADINGILRGKRLPRNQVEKAFKGSLRMPLSSVGVDIWGSDVLGNAQVFETGDADGVLQPTERGILPVTWTKQPTALLPLWVANEDGSAYAGDSRRVLANIVERFHSAGLTPVTATELEFYLVDPKKNRPRPPKSAISGERLAFNGVYSADELDAFGPFLRDLYAGCEAQGIPADAAIAENGCGQFEINLLHVADPLRAADDALFFKRLVKGVARRHGLAASFMAKPYGDQSGSGFHVHFSLIDKNGRNVFDNGGVDGTDILHHAVGGLLAAMAESTLLFAPHLNSYRRLRKGTHAPVAPAWGYENRTTAIRIPGGAPVARRIEHRVAGADANPYLVMAALLGAALIGIERQMRPADPIEGDAYALDLPCLPTDWPSAMAAFEAGKLATEILNPTLHKMITACKRQEMERFAAHVTDFEYQSYLDVV